jgi:hypothetical protein
MSVMKTTLAILSTAAFLATTTLFWLFMADTHRLGGDALNGREENGRYFVRDHGRTTEVSEDDWRRNRTLGIVVFSTFPLGMLGMAYVNCAVLLPKFMFRASGDERDARVRQVAATGPALATCKCAGKIGWIGASRGLFTATVHPGGLVVRVRFIGSVALRPSDIRSITVVSEVFQKVARIDHASDQSANPIRLMCAKDVAFMAALRTLVDRAA